MCTNLELKINLELSDLRERERKRLRDMSVCVWESERKKTQNQYMRINKIGLDRQSMKLNPKL